jgi:glycosyltransferase involved in cell wall biosynthesis
MLKIAIDCRMTGSGGIGSFINELIPHFLNNNECLLIGTHEQCQDFLRLQNVEFCWCDVKPFSLKEMFSFPREVLKKINSCDCFFTPYINIPGGIKVPVFSTIHDIVFLDVPGLTGFTGRIIRKYFYQRAINLSKALFTVSEFSKERILFKLRCKKEISVVYNSAPSYLTKDNGNSNTIQKTGSILFVGNIKKHKGLSTLLEAYSKAVNKGLKYKLLITGSKDNFRTKDIQTSKLLEEASSLNIEFTGKVSNEKLKEIYKSSNVLVQPSIYEGFGMPPLEAMTLGTPAIISDIPVFKEIYGDFPVVFFKTGDSDDLCTKLLEFEKNPFEADIKDRKDRYSYKKSAQIILDNITKYINC